MRRSQLLILVMVVSLATFVILLAALTAAPVTALPVESPLGAPSEAVGQQLEMGEQPVTLLPNAIPDPSLRSLYKVQDQPLEPSASLQINVNYADDWVAGATDAFASVAITVTDGGEDPQETATVGADDSGDFFVGCENWDSGNCPDIGPGDNVAASVVGATAEITTVGSIMGDMDIAGDLITGTLNANWLPNPADVQCEIRQDTFPIITNTADPDGGSFNCDFTDEWDLQKFDNVVLRYYEPDGDSVMNNALWPWSRVNYAHDWVGGDYNAGHTLWITVTDEVDELKALNVTTSEPGLGWGAEYGYDTGETPWWPEQPDIVPFDHVYITGDDGYTNTLEVGLISATIGLAANEISGTINAPGFGVSLTVECHPWGAWDAGMNDVETKSSWAEPDGSVPFSCSWDPVTEWDIQPGQDIAVMYTEPDGDLIIDVYRVPAAYMMIDTWSEGNPGEGGNFQHQINYRNDGDLTAESVVITDTMEGMLFVGQTSLFSIMTYTIPGGEVVVFNVGSVDPGEEVRFLIYGSVEVAAGETITNTAEIDTTTQGQGDPGAESVSTRVVQPNDTHLNVGKHAWTGDPAPGETFVFGVRVCNNGETNSSDVLMEDVLQYPAISLQHFWSDDLGWYEVDSDDAYLAMAIPSIQGHSCSEVYLDVQLDTGVNPGDYLTNTVIITASNDLENDGNWDFWQGNANDPYLNLWIDKGLNWGALVPGGELSYGINYGNDGNVPAGPFLITDTLPVSTTFAGAWHNDPMGGFDFEPLVVTDDYVVWELPGLENGWGGDFEVRLLIDPGAFPWAMLENIVEITRFQGEDTHEDNESAWIEVVNPPGPNLRVFKNHGWDGGHRLNYQIKFENIGDETVTGVWITDTMPLGTTWDGGWHLEFDWERWITTTVDGRDLMWNFTDINPGESGWLYFGLDLDEPDTPLRWYTNDVKITVPPGDPTPGDNFDTDVAFSGGEVRRVELWLNPDDTADVWGEAVSGHVTVTTPYDQYYAWAGSDCGGCWNIDGSVPLFPGDLVTVEAGAGLMSVATTVPDPFHAQIDTGTNTVFGQIGGWLTQTVEIYGDWPEGYIEVTTDLSGNFLAAYDDIPRGASGYVRLVDEVSYSDVIYHRPFWDLDLVLDINYGHDWVEGQYEPGHTVWITVTESDGETVKGQAELWTEYLDWWDETGFSTERHGWLGDRPDIQPGDWVFAMVDNDHSTEVKIGDIGIELNLQDDIVHGPITATLLSDPFPVSCSIWTQDGPSIDLEVPLDPGYYNCDFGALGWNLGPPGTIGVSYVVSNGDRIYNTFDWLQIRSDIGPASNGDRQVWGHNAGANETVTVTVNTGGGAFEAEATTLADEGGDFNTQHNLPEGSLSDWNQVDVASSNGITGTMTIYPMSGAAYPDTDVISITADAPPHFTLQLEYCEQDWCDSYDMGEIGGSGTVTVNLRSERDFYVRPGTSYIAHLDTRDGHEVRYIWDLPAPELGVWKWNTSGHARPDGIVVYGLQYRNDGNGPAESVTIVDELPGDTYYYGDTSGLPVTIGSSGTITWDLGTVDPGEDVSFMATFSLTSSYQDGDTIPENCASIHSPTEGDWNPDNDWNCTGPVDVWDVDVEMGVNKGSNPGDPSPGQEFTYDIGVCNNRGAAAGPVILTDTLPAGVTLIDWWPNDWNYNLWGEVYNDGHELVLYAPGFPGDTCDQITLQVFLDPAVDISTTIENLVVIDVPGDVYLENNWQLHQDLVSPPRYDLSLNKNLNGGSLVPGGNVGFSIEWQNQGNVTTTVHITDTYPPGLSYAGGWWGGNTPWQDEPLPDPSEDGSQLVWVLPEIPVGYQYGMNIQFDIVAPDPVPELVNCATVASDGPDDWPEDNTDCVTFPVNPTGPNLTVEKWHDWNGDGQLQYNIRFLNIGDQTIGDVWITDTLPDLTNWNGYWDMWYDWNRLVGGDVIHDGNQLKWNFSELYPGDQGHIQFQVDLDHPGEPLHWYTNTVEITLPPGDTDPGDNLHKDVAFSGSEIRWVDVNVYSDNIWGFAAVGPLTVTTQHEEEYFGGGDFDWYANFPFLPGEVVTLTAGTGQLPVFIEIPEPFDVEGSSVTNVVQGQIDHLDSEWIEVGLDGGPDIQTQTDGDGFFDVLFDDIPRGGTGEVRYLYMVDYTDVTLHRGWSSPDLILEVNYGHDWVEGQYETGHTVWITVTGNNTSTIKGTAQLDTRDFGGWTGFSTSDGWTLEPDDIAPEDWVFGRVDNGFTGEVQVFTIEGYVDVDNDFTMGNLDAPWYIGEVDYLDVACYPWGAWDMGMQEVEEKYSSAPPNGSTPFFCQWDPDTEWDIDYFQEIAIYVDDPDGDKVINVFAGEVVDMQIEKWQVGNYAQPGGVQVYGISYQNMGNIPADGVFISDTLPMSTTYAGDTSGLTVTVGSGNVISWEVGVLNPDEGGIFYVTVDVDLGTPEGEGVLEPNCVALQTSTEPEFDPENDSSCSGPVDVWIDEVELSVSKGTTPGDPAPGQMFTYNIQWCNNRGAATGPAWMTDTLPTDVIYHGWQEAQDWQNLWTEVSFDGSELVLYAPGLPGDSCDWINIVMELGPDVPIGTTLISEVVIYAEGDVVPENNGQVHEVDVSLPRYDLEISKGFDWGVLAPEGYINYSIDYRNNGNVASGVMITETIPDGLSFNAAWWAGGQPDEGQSLPDPIMIDDLLIWELDELPIGEYRSFHVEMSIDPETDPGEFGNCVEISGDGTDDTPEDNTSCETVTTYLSGPNVRVFKHGEWSHEGQRIDYNILFHNVGDVPLFDVVITDTFPVGTFATNEPGNDYHYPIHSIDMTGQNMWSFIVEEIHPGDRGNILFQVELENPGELGSFYTNTVEAAIQSGEVDKSDNYYAIEAATQSGEVDESDNYYATVSTNGPDLFVEKELVDGELLPGELITFSLTFGNDRYGHEWWWGLQHPAVLTDTLPIGFEYISSTLRFCGSDNDWCVFEPNIQNDDVLVWQLWPIGTGQWNEIELTVRITDTAEGDDVFTNWVEILSSEPLTDVEPFYDNNQDSADVVIALPKFEVSKLHESSEVAGMTVAYTITVENSGSEPGTNVVVSDTLPAGLDYGGGDGTYDGTAVTWTFSEILEDGGTASGTFTATLPCTGTVMNDDYLVISSDQGVSSESGPAVEFDVMAPTIAVSLGHTPEPIVVGSTVYFTATGVTDGTTLTYTWDYGDGEFGSGEFTNQSYPSDAAYNIVLTATDSCLYESIQTAEITIDPPALAASFDQSASAIPIHSTVYFTDTSSTDGPAIVAWEWDFGDGSASATTQNVSHLYSAFGTFDVTLVVTDELGYSDSVLVVDAVSTLAPVFEISKEYQSSEVAGTLVAYTLTFTNIGSLTGTGLVITDALPANVTWVSGGSYDDGTGIVSWTWPSLSPGMDESVQFVGQLGCSGQVVNDSYQVASSDQGSSSPLGAPVSFAIQNPTITASFTQSAAEVRVGDNVVFTSTSTTNGAAIVSWLWDFGDGEMDSGEIVTYAYDEAGGYDVELTVQDACGNSDTITMTNAVVVEEADYYIFIPIINKP